MLHSEHWDSNGASLIALGHLLTASNAFKGIWGADEIAGPDLVTLCNSTLWHQEEIKLKFDKTGGAGNARTEQTQESVHDK